MAETWFERAVDPGRVAAELSDVVPQLAGGSSALTGARMIRLRAAEPEGHWTATYLLQTTGAAGAADTISAHGLLVPPGAPDPQVSSVADFGGDGWQCWLPKSRVLLHTWSADEALPGLAAVTDPTTGRDLLEELLRASSPGRHDLALRAVTATVAAYKPGARVTLVCDLDYGRADVPPAWPRAVVAKAHLEDEGVTVYEAQQALWASPLATSEMVAVAEPIGYVPELSLSVQGHLEHERTLKDLLAQGFDAAPGTGPDPEPAMRATAAAIAAVHTSGVRYGERTTWEDELAGQLKKHSNLMSVVPWLGELTAGVPERLAAAGARTRADPPGPSHGSFRTAQVLLMKPGVGIIDFDKLRQAEPAADIGPFLSKLRHTAVNKGEDSRDNVSVPARVDTLRDAFLDAYRSAAPLSAERLACWEALEHFSLVLGSAKKGLAERGASCASMMHRHLDAHGL